MKERRAETYDDWLKSRGYDGDYTLPLTRAPAPTMREWQQQSSATHARAVRTIAEIEAADVKLRADMQRLWNRT